MPVPDAVESLLGTRVARLPADVRRVLARRRAERRSARAAQLATRTRSTTRSTPACVIVDGERVRASHPLLAAVAKERSRPRSGVSSISSSRARRPRLESRALHLALATELPDEELAAAIAAAAAAAAARGAAEQAVVLAEHAFRLTPAESTERAGASARARRVPARDRRRRAGGRAALTSSSTPCPSGAARARAHLLLAESRATLTEHEYERLVDLALEESEGDPALRATVLARKSLHLAAGLVRRLGDAEAMALEALPAAREAGLDVEHEVLFSLGSIRTMRGRAIDDLIASFEGDRLRDLVHSLDRVASVRLGWRGDVPPGPRRPPAASVARRRARTGVRVRRRALEPDRRRAAGGRMGRSDCAARRVGAVRRRRDPHRRRPTSASGRSSQPAADTRRRPHGGPSRRSPCGEAGGHAVARCSGRCERAGSRPCSRTSRSERSRACSASGSTPARGRGRSRSVPCRARSRRGAPRGRPSRRGEGGHRAAEPSWPRTGAPVGAREREAMRRARPARLDTVRRGGGSGGSREAAAAYEELGLRFDAARSLLSLGRAQRRHEEVGSRAALARARRGRVRRARLAGLGRRGSLGAGAGRGPPRPQAAGELTPTERRVAELAAEGLSNKEIARALFVTVSTVEVHLSHAYAKLGVRSRGAARRASLVRFVAPKLSGFPVFRAGGRRRTVDRMARVPRSSCTSRAPTRPPSRGTPSAPASRAPGADTRGNAGPLPALDLRPRGRDLLRPDRGPLGGGGRPGRAPRRAPVRAARRGGTSRHERSSHDASTQGSPGGARRSRRSRRSPRAWPARRARRRSPTRKA